MPHAFPKNSRPKLRHFCTLSVCALALFSATVKASPPPPQPTIPASYTWPAEPTTPPTSTVRPTGGRSSVMLVGVGLMRSEPNETLPHFLARVGRVLHDFTTQTRFEACGVIGENPSDPHRFVVPLVTNGSHIACTPDPSWLGDALDTGETIHSHPIASPDMNFVPFRVNRSDRELMRVTSGVAPMVNRKLLVFNGRNETFSRHDLKTPGGWLVADGHLLQHQTSGEVVNHGEVSSTSAKLFPIPPNASQQVISYWAEGNFLDVDN